MDYLLIISIALTLLGWASTFYFHPLRERIALHIGATVGLIGLGGFFVYVIAYIYINGLFK